MFRLIFLWSINRRIKADLHLFVFSMHWRKAFPQFLGPHSEKSVNIQWKCSHIQINQQCGSIWHFTSAFGVCSLVVCKTPSPSIQATLWILCSPDNMDVCVHVYESNNLLCCHCWIRLQQEGCTHAVPRGGEDYSGGDQEQRANCSGGEVRGEPWRCVCCTVCLMCTNAHKLGFDSGPCVRFLYKYRKPTTKPTHLGWHIKHKWCQIVYHCLCQAAVGVC